MANERSSNRGLIATVLALSLVGGTLLGAYVMTTPDARRVPDALRRQSGARKPDGAKALVPRYVGDKLTMVKHEVKVPQGQDARVHLVNEFLRESKIAAPDARAIGIDVRDGVAFLDFNQAFDQTHGTDDEGILVNGILATLGQFPEIERVQFQVNSEPITTLGNLDLSFPQPVLHAGESEAVSVAP